MKKGDATKQRIVEQSAYLMNRKGFIATSLADIMDATGLQKGGFYNHFKNKEDLSLQAFDYCCSVQSKLLGEATAAPVPAADKLKAFVDAFFQFPIPGGCPIIHVAVETEDQPGPHALKEAARAKMDERIGLLASLIETGQRAGQIPGGLDPREEAAALMAEIEGAILLYSLYEDRAHIDRAKRRLYRELEERFAVRAD
ncbi:TetR/AcrR family transcriptional regulator [Gorillibacterium sp. sgz500922]|uniref:TetR/AcrR family transcriptional regulator n=1 Tax=Gorillibacterium sp. sgz500922 TaxID=3446694 RepID=UPI003F678622